MKRFWLTVLFFIIASAILIFGFRQKSLHATEPALRGILNLSGDDMSSGNYVLEGQWEFYWSQLLGPGDIPQFAPSYINIPSLWNNIELNGTPLSTDGYATYKLKVILPQKKPRLALKIFDTYCSYRLYINNSLVAENGNPATTKTEAVPFWNTKTVAVPAGTDTLELTMQVANFWHSKGGVYKAPVLAEMKRLSHDNDIAWGMDVFFTGCFFMSGLLFFGLYLFAKDDKSILYFSIFCILYCYRIIGTEPYIFHGLANNISWYITIRLEYISLVLSVAFFSLYMRYLYPEETNRTLIRILFWICLIYTAIIMVAPVKVFAPILPVYLAAMFFYIGYAFYVFAMASRHSRSGSDYAFLSSGVALILFFTINLNYFGIIYPTKVAIFAGYIVFLFLQSLILSYRVSFRLKKSADDAQQGLKAKSEFLSTMSHEIRTPLNAVIGMSNILLHENPREDQKENLEVLSFSANNLMSIVNNILDFSKLDAGQMRFEHIEMDIRKIGENIVKAQQQYADEKNIRLKYLFDENLPDKIIGDPTRLTQVINNLVHNAIKFTKEGWVRLSILKESRETENSIAVKVIVEDTGIGIASEHQKMIFDRFTQADSSTSRSYGGTGLGLAICKRILELQHTILHVESEPGGGASFWFVQTFPLVTPLRSDTLSETKSTLPDSKPLQGCCILLVEDNVFNTMVAKTILIEFGATVDTVMNGKEAVEKLDPAIHQVILMDLNMPVMDGYEAARLIKEKYPSIPIIALTATTPEQMHASNTSSDFADILSKPFNPDNLCRSIMKHTNRLL